VALQTAAWRVLGASVPGSGHLAAQHGCDDAHAFRQHADGTVVLVVADGAGSASRAAEGAACAVQVVLDACGVAFAADPAPATDDAWERLLDRTLGAGHQALVALAAADRGAQAPEQQRTADVMRELATTLLLAVVTADWLAVAQIGDGVIVVQDSRGHQQALTWPEHGEYINQTSFLSDEDYLEHVQYRVVEAAEVRGIALLTDGLEMLALDAAEREPYSPFFSPLFAYGRQDMSTEEALGAFLESPRVCSRTDDDKTLLLAVR
jgi:hypothetical protein